MRTAKLRDTPERLTGEWGGRRRTPMPRGSFAAISNE